MASAPGTAFNHDGGGTAVLADLLTRGTGKPLDDDARELLFTPMGTQRRTWSTTSTDVRWPSTACTCAPRDPLKIGPLMLDPYRWQGWQVIPVAWVDRALQPQPATGVSDFRCDMQWWAGAVQWHAQLVIWHAAFGNGGSRLFVLPPLDLAIVTTAGAYGPRPSP